MSKASKKLQFVIFDDIESILAHLQSTNDANSHLKQQKSLTLVIDYRQQENYESVLAQKQCEIVTVVFD